MRIRKSVSARDTNIEHFRKKSTQELDLKLGSKKRGESGLETNQKDVDVIDIGLAIIAVGLIGALGRLFALLLALGNPTWVILFLILALGVTNYGVALLVASESWRHRAYVRTRT